MPSIEELGRETKQQNPGAYDEYSDYEVGMAMKEEYPGRFDDYVDESTGLQFRDKNATFQQALKDIVGEKDSLFTDTQALEKKVNQLIDSFNPNQGIMTAWFKEKRLAKHTEILKHLTANQRLVLEQFEMMAKAVRGGKTDEIEFKIFAAKNAVMLMEIQAHAQRLEKAAELGITEATYTFLKDNDAQHVQNLRHDKESFELDKEKAIFEIDQRIREARQMAEIDIDKQVELVERTADIEMKKEAHTAKLSWEKYHNENMLDAHLAIQANLQPIAEANELTKRLVMTIKDIHLLKQLPEGYVTQETMRAMEMTKNYLERLIKEKHEGLLQGVSREKQSGVEEEEPDSES